MNAYNFEGMFTSVFNLTFTNNLTKLVKKAGFVSIQKMETRVKTIARS